MHSEGFIAAVMAGGHALREMPYIGSSKIKNVYLPFGSEYALRLKNDHLARCVARVWIDGESAVEGGVVIAPRQKVDLERFLIDGNLNRGRKFKFVSTSHDDVQDPSNLLNGLVRIEFELEETKNSFFSMDPKLKPYSDTSPPPWKPLMVLNSSGSVSVFSPRGIFSPYSDENKLGATVPGGVSTQKFEQVEIETNPSTCVSLMFKLNPSQSETAVTTKATRYVYCPECGGKSRRSAKFCHRCGRNLKKLLAQGDTK